MVEKCAVIQGHQIRPSIVRNEGLSPDSLPVLRNDGFFEGSSQKHLADYFGDMTSMNLSSGEKIKKAPVPGQSPQESQRGRVLNFEQKIKSMDR